LGCIIGGINYHHHHHHHGIIIIVILVLSVLRKQRVKSRETMMKQANYYRNY